MSASPAVLFTFAGGGAQKAIADQWSSDGFGKIYTARIPAILARQYYVAAFLDSKLNLQGKTVLDIGAGEGQFLEIAKRYGAELFGVEPSTQNCTALTKLGFESFCGTIEDFRTSADFRSGSADIVTIMWTLENCLSVQSMLGTAFEILKEGGHVLVATGSRILVPFKKPLASYLSTDPTDLHCFRFSANTLQKALAVNGFSPVVVNQFIDSDVLCVVAKKCAAAPGKRSGAESEARGENSESAEKQNPAPEFLGDNWRKVYDFFERWHKESLHYE